ncbi:hypothetical protein D9M71_837690 [compost metagenome]
MHAVLHARACGGQGHAQAFVGKPACVLRAAADGLATTVADGRARQAFVAQRERAQRVHGGLRVGHGAAVFAELLDVLQA